jgi:hypothetical protein
MSFYLFGTPVRPSPPRKKVAINLAVQNPEVVVRLDRYHFSAGETDYELHVIPISKLDFLPGKMANCYVFESDEAMTPWILGLRRYLPTQPDWTTTAEVLTHAGLPSDAGLQAVGRLIVEGKVIPLEPFGTTWLFMRRHYTVLFSKECCDAIDFHQRSHLLNILRSHCEWKYGDRESMVTVADFMTECPVGPGIGERYHHVIHEIVSWHGLKFTDR